MVNHNESSEQTPKEDQPVVPRRAKGDGVSDLLSHHFVGNAVSHENGRLVIEFEEAQETIVVATGQSVILGKGTQNSPHEVTLDLRPYGASDKGVSRRHARLHRTTSIIYITDLSSRNGTFLNGERLSSNQARILRDEDEVHLGKFAFRVHIR